jgi:uncharacterized membrane protein
MMNRKLTWALLASLLINALLVGYIVGNHGRGGPFGIFKTARPMPDRMMPDRMMPGMMMRGGADDATREILRNAFDAERDALRGALKNAAAARRASETILRADPLDTAQLDATMAQLRASNTAAQESFHRALRDAAQKLDATQRQTLGRWLERAPSARMGQGPDGRGGPRGGDRMIPPPPGGELPAPIVAPLPDGMGLGAPLPPPAGE